MLHEEHNYINNYIMALQGELHEAYIVATNCFPVPGTAALQLMDTGNVPIYQQNNTVYICTSILLM